MLCDPALLPLLLSIVLLDLVDGVSVAVPSMISFASRCLSCSIISSMLIMSMSLVLILRSGCGSWELLAGAFEDEGLFLWRAMLKLELDVG